ncbi:MAG: DUF4232 domain-containing protein [Kutzneria sp.]|nr:DUF4232 domain-containing protein [Kutzneria sp.]
MHATTRGAAGLFGIGLVTAFMACGPQRAPAAMAATFSAQEDAPGVCTTEELAIALGPGNGAAGHFYVPVTFTNESTADCTIAGYPAVSYVTGKAGTQIGDAAVWSPASTPTVTLHPGQQASATVDQVDVANFPASMCEPVDAAGLRVYPPNNTVPVFLSEPNARACAKQMPSWRQLSVRPVQSDNAPRTPAPGEQRRDGALPVTVANNGQPGGDQRSVRRSPLGEWHDAAPAERCSATAL